MMFEGNRDDRSNPGAQFDRSLMAWTTPLNDQRGHISE